MPEVLWAPSPPTRQPCPHGPGFAHRAQGTPKHPSSTQSARPEEHHGETGPQPGL